MSFSSEAKEELCSLSRSPCCRRAMLYGLLQTGHAFSAAAISLLTEHEGVAALYAALLSEACGVKAVEEPREGGGTYVHLPQAADRQRVLVAFGHTGREVTLRLNRANFECEECAAAYLAGAFLACGAITNPENAYHLEFRLPYYTLCGDLAALMGEMDLHPKQGSRKGSRLLYFKESEQIEDCLTRMGATGASLELMGVKMVKDIRNNTNRVVNCENANIDKTVAAAAPQLEAIRRIRERGAMGLLPPELRALADLRWDNPEMSLRELGEALDPPISRSGVNHRLRRLMEYAEEPSLEK